MVSTSNCPPLVAMSVVTRWRSTFSSSVTHLTVTSGFLAVKSPVIACMRIMSLLFTVAMVRVVCAFEGAEANKATAPNRAPVNSFTVSSHISIRIIRFIRALSICPCVELMFTSTQKVVKPGLPSPTANLPPSAWSWPIAPTHDRPRSCYCRFIAMRNLSPAPHRARIWGASALAAQDRAGGRLVGDQAVDQPAFQRRLDGRNLALADRRADGEGGRRNARRNAGQAAGGATVDV